MAGSAEMTTGAKKPKNLGTMRAATPADMTESEEAARQAEARAREASQTPVTPPSMTEIQDQQMLDKMQKAYDNSRQNMKAGGGYVKAADGCAMRGKTRGKMV
jgi:hypothetical protein